MRGAALRATSILQHMEERHETSPSNVAPDATSYTTVINAWARSREKDAAIQAEQVLQKAKESFAAGNELARPNALTYNSMINCYAKSNDRNASKKALTTLDLMKEICQTEGFEDCHPDVVTYTSAIDCVAKTRVAEAADNAEKLIQELEFLYEESDGDSRMKPNMRTYTSVSRHCCRVRMCCDLFSLVILFSTGYQRNCQEWSRPSSSSGNPRQDFGTSQGR